MNNEIEQAVREIIAKNLRLKMPIDKIKNSDDLTTLGMSSIDIVKVIVAIESKFGFEFEDEDLIIDNFENINNLAAYVKGKI